MYMFTCRRSVCSAKDIKNNETLTLHNFLVTSLNRSFPPPVFLPPLLKSQLGHVGILPGAQENVGLAQKSLRHTTSSSSSSPSLYLEEKQKLVKKT